MTQESGKVWALVGDAAFGVPFFRALNDGLLCATELSCCLAAHARGVGTTTAPQPTTPASMLTKLSRVR